MMKLPKPAVVGLYILDDSLWNSLATGKDGLTIGNARSHCDAYIDDCLAHRPGTC